LDFTNVIFYVGSNLLLLVNEEFIGLSIDLSLAKPYFIAKEEEFCFLGVIAGPLSRSPNPVEGLDGTAMSLLSKCFKSRL
jgi:hypothetical protein